MYTVADIEEQKNHVKKINEEELLKMKNVCILKLKEKQSEVETCEQNIKELNEQLQHVS